MVRANNNYKLMYVKDIISADDPYNRLSKNINYIIND